LFPIFKYVSTNITRRCRFVPCKRNCLLTPGLSPAFWPVGFINKTIYEKT